MKPICAICGRRTTPFAWRGGLPVGPKCAAKAGMTTAKASASKGLRSVRATTSKAVNTRETGDLFEGLE